MQRSSWHLCCSHTFILPIPPTTLSGVDNTLESAEGVQQGDHLGPLHFCRTIHQLMTHLRSEFHVFYLDDGTLGGNWETVIQDLRLVEFLVKQLGLQLNKAMSEVTCNDTSTLIEFWKLLHISK